MTMIRTAAIALCCCFLGGCLLERSSAPAPRLLTPLPLPAGAAAADPLPARLATVSAGASLRQDLLRYAADGEVRRDAEWRWADLPEVLLARSLAAAAAPAGIQLAERPDVPALAVELTRFGLAEVDGKPALVAEIVLRITATDRSVRLVTLSDREAVANALPGTVPAATATLLTRLAATAWSDLRSTNDVR
jgi:hypothetical protein